MDTTVFTNITDSKKYIKGRLQTESLNSGLKLKKNDLRETENSRIFSHCINCVDRHKEKEEDQADAENISVNFRLHWIWITKNIKWLYYFVNQSEKMCKNVLVESLF